MKRIIFLIIVMIPIALLPQQSKSSLWKYAVYYSSGELTYNGTELITNAIDRGMEVGANVIINGTFDADASWTKQAGWTISGGTANFSGLETSKYIIQAAVLTTGHRYALSVDATNFAGAGVNPYLLGVGDLSLTGNGSFKFRAVAAGANYLIYAFLNRSFSVDNVTALRIPTYVEAGNHIADSSAIYKQAGNYSLKITSSAAGNGTTNTISLASTLFTAVTNGSNYRFQVYAYTSTANTTLTFKLGDIVKTAIVPTSGMTVINYDFKATASTTGNIILYLDKAATVYIDDVSLKSGQ